MAKRSTSTSSKKSLKSLFSKSEVNLKESSEKDDSSGRSKTLKFFTWRRKKKVPGGTTAIERAESPGPDAEDWPDADQKASFYATAPRSKGLLSSSETDLHKPKRLSSFSLGWRKKKKKVALSQNIASINPESDVKDQDREQNNEEQEDMEEHYEVVKPASTHNLPSFIFTDQHQHDHTDGLTEGAGPATADLTPGTLDGTFISYIDSDSDGYHTPPESPGMDAVAFFHAPSDIGATGQSLAESFSTSPSLHLETYPEITTTANFATPESQKATDFTIKSDSITPVSHDMVQAVLSIPAESPVDGSEVSTSAASITESSISTDSSSVNSSLMKKHHVNDSHAAYSWDHSVTLQAHDRGMSDKPVDNTIPASSSAMEAEGAESSQGHTESNNLHTTFSTSVFPQNSISSPAPSLTKQTSGQVTERRAVQVDLPSKFGPADISDMSLHNREMSFNTTDGTTPAPTLPASVSTLDNMIPNTEHSPNIKQGSSDHNPGPGWASSSLGEVSGDSVLKDASNFIHNPPHFPVLPEVMSSNTEPSSFSVDRHNSEEVSAVDISLSSKKSYSIDVTDSDQPTLTTVKPVCLGFEPVPLQDESNISLTGDIIMTSDSGSSYTLHTMTNPSSTMMYTHMSGLDHSRKEPDLARLVPPEPKVCTGLSSETFSKVTPNTLSFESAATDHLTTHPDICYHTPSSLTEQQEVNIGTQINLRTNKGGERREEQQISLQGQDEFTVRNEPVWNSATLGNHCESVESIDVKSAPKRYSGIDNPVKALDEAQLTSLEKGNMEEHPARNQVQDKAEEMLGSFYASETGTDAQQYAEAQDQSGRESEIPGGEAARQLSDPTITKPDAPVLRERVPEECAAAPPWSPHGEASITDYRPATHTDLGAGYSPSLAMLSAGTITLQHDKAGGGAKGSAVSLYAERGDNATQEQVTHTETSRSSREDFRVSTGEETSDYAETQGPRGQEAQVTASLFRSSYTAETTAQSTPKTIRDTLRYTPETEAQDTDSGKAEAEVRAGRQHQHSAGLSHLSFHSEAEAVGTIETSRTVTERSTPASGVIVYDREFGLDNSEKEDDRHSARTSAVSDQNYTSPGLFSHAFSVLSSVAEESDTESPVESPSGSDTDMSSGIGVLSTSFTLKPKGSQEGKEDGKRVHKVSLVSSSSSINSSGHYTGENGLRDETETNGASHEPVSVWTSSQREDLRSIPEESTSSVLERSRSGLSDNPYLYSSKSSSSYEPTAYSSYSYSYSSETRQEGPPSSVSMDTTDSTSNSSWRNLRSEVQQSSESEASRRSWEEPFTPAGQGERGREREGGITNTGSDSHTQHAEQSDSYFSGVFKATRVELPSSPTDADPDFDPDTSMPASPHDMETLLDTLKSMGPPVRHRSLRNSSSQPISSLPPIVEDAPSPTSAPLSSPTSPGPSSLPPDLGLSWNSMKDMRSPLAMMKEQQGSELPGRSIVLPSRASALSSIVMRKSSLSDLNVEDGTQVNGGGLLGSSRLDHSLIFSNYRSEQGENGKALGHRSLFRTASLPEVSSGLDRLSMPPKGIEQLGSGTSRLERLSILTSPPGSLTGLNDMSRISLSPLIQNNSIVESPILNHTPPHSLELYRSLSPESPVKHPTPPSLQRSLSAEGPSAGSPVFNDVMRGFGPPQEQGPERNFVAKYRAFPDAYLTKEKEHGKLNPRPGKMFIYNRPGLRGQRTEVRGDVMDATAWQFPETISIRVVRGGWVLYEKPDFKGEKIALDEGDIELTYPFGPVEDRQGPTQNGTQGSEEDSSEPKPTAPRQFVIGSLRRAVRDYSVPEICLFPEENAEGKKVVFRDTSEDARIFGFPIKANSIIINAGLWLVFAEPFFQGVPRVLEVGGFSNPAAWGVTQPYISSLHPLKIGEPKVEKPNEPKLVIYDKPYFTGKSREIYTNTRDFMTREGNQQTAFMFNAGSIKVIGGIWVGYEKEGFRGHQYLLEEGEYHDWRVWGGCDSELRSVRVIRTDLSQPMLVMFEMSIEEEQQEERTFEVTEAVPDVELFDFRPATRSIHVLSGAWVAYSHVDYSGHQYVLEKGFYNNCADWGSEDNHICSIQPILQAPATGPGFRNELQLYSEPGFQGKCQVFSQSHEALPDRLPMQSCRVVGGSWVLYEDSNYMGNQYVLSEGDYADFTSMGCPANCSLRSIKSVPLSFSVPSISLFGLECFEGREVTLETEVSNMMEEGFNPHVLSVRVNSGCWVLCEHTNYRGRQYLLEPIEITNWHKFSSLASVGSMYPIRAKRKLFRIRYKETGHYMSVQGGVDTMKSGRVVVSEQVEDMSDIWFYQDGLIKNKLIQTMSLQVMGNVESGAKVVLWSETRTPVQTWSAQLSGAISSLTFPGLVLDVKGGKTYDKEHVIVRSDSEESASQLWELELL